MLRISFILLFFLNALSLQGQSIQLKLDPVANPFNNTFYEIVSIEAGQKTTFGSIYNPENKKTTVGFTGTLDSNLMEFFDSSTIKSKGKTQPILIKVGQFDLSESIQGRNVAAGTFKMKFSFYVQGEFEPVHLVDFEGGMDYKRSTNRIDLVQQVVNQGMGNMLKFFDDWMNNQQLSNRQLATSVNISIVTKNRKSSRDSVFYDPQRPITWNDFRDKPGNKSRFNAAIFTSLAMEGDPYVSDGQIHMPIEVKVYMLPGSSWVRSPNDYSLNHEQRHFDVTRIVGDRLIATLTALELTPDNYDAEINDAFFDAYREMNKLQELYDKQTAHGINKDEQFKWNAMLDEGLFGNWKRLEVELLKAPQK